MTSRPYHFVIKDLRDLASHIKELRQHKEAATAAKYTEDLLREAANLIETLAQESGRAYDEASRLRNPDNTGQ